MDNLESIVLGSGDIYVDEFDSSTGLPENSAIEVEEKRMGHISGGATLEYNPTFYEAKDDYGRVSKTILTEEEATLKTGLITWCADTLEQLCSTARVTESGNRRIAKIGGTGNQTNQKYVIHFLHKDSEDGDIRVTIVGNNQAGFSLAFAKDKETTIDAEFKAMPQDDDGTLIYYEEVIDPDAEEDDDVEEA